MNWVHLSSTKLRALQFSETAAIINHGHSENFYASFKLLPMEILTCTMYILLNFFTCQVPCETFAPYKLF